MIMHGNVDDELRFHGSILEVCGPIFWAGVPAGGLPATDLTLVSVTVIPASHGGPVSATPNGVVFDQNNNPVEWMFELDGNWAAGLATVHVEILPGTGRSGHQPQEHWNVTGVALKPAA